MTPPTQDRLAEIEGRGWYDQGPDDFKWLIEEVKRLRAQDGVWRTMNEGYQQEHERLRDINKGTQPNDC